MENTKGPPPGEAASENKMGTAPVLKLIATMSLPAMFSMLVQALYNIVDSFFVAQIGENALTAVSLAFPIQSLMIAVGVGTGIGINSLVSRRLGEGRREEANAAADHGLLLGLLSGLAFAVFGLFFTRPFFEGFTQVPDIVEMGMQYCSVVTIFSFGCFVQINMEKTLQATGNMIYPMLFQLVGCVTNIILDPIMIFGLLGCPRMGVTGAAVATVIGQLVAMAFSLYVAFAKSHEVTISFRGFRPSLGTIRAIYSVGLPSIVMQSITSVLVMALNSILIAFTETAVAVLGIYFKLQSFVYMPVFGLTQGVMPIIGYNYGARNKDRLLSTVKIGSIAAGIIMAAGTALFLLLPEQMLAIFKASPQMLEIGVPALRIICISFLPAALGIVFSTLFQAVGMGGKSLFVSVLRQLVIILPAAWLLSKVGLAYVWYAFPIAEYAALVISCVLLWRVNRDVLQHLAPASRTL